MTYEILEKQLLEHLDKNGTPKIVTINKSDYLRILNDFSMPFSIVNSQTKWFGISLKTSYEVPKGQITFG
jgi:hypothetical protein